jgi:membrane protein required for colicin V production
MFIDFLLCILLLMAVFKGYSRGLIVAVFSLVAFFIGLVAAMKCSASVAVWLQDKAGSHSAWMPFIAFVLVMAVVMLLIRFGANLIERAVKFAMFGWLNKLGGMVFYAAIYIILFSIVLFFAKNMSILTEETIQESTTYSFIAPLGPKAIDAIGSVMPVFKGLFNQLETFFDGAAHRINADG